MSLLPFVFDIDQDFGSAFIPNDMFTAAVSVLLSRDFHRPWRQLAAVRDVGSTINSDTDKFQINIDVQHFAPKDISVKATDGYVVIEGNHEEKKDEHGYISRQCTRRYALPEGCNPEIVESRLSSDGVLTVVAPKQIHSCICLKNQRLVLIAQTGPIRKEIKDQTSSTINHVNFK